MLEFVVSHAEMTFQIFPIWKFCYFLKLCKFLNKDRCKIPKVFKSEWCFIFSSFYIMALSHLLNILCLIEIFMFSTLSSLHGAPDSVFPDKNIKIGFKSRNLSRIPYNYMLIIGIIWYKNFWHRRTNMWNVSYHCLICILIC